MSTPLLTATPASPSNEAPDPTETPSPDAPPHAAAQDASEPLWEPLAVLIEDPDDPFVSARLPELLRIYPTAPAAEVVEHPQVLARLCAMRDVPFLAAVLTLAQPDHGGQQPFATASRHRNEAGLRREHNAKDQQDERATDVDQKLHGPDELCPCQEEQAGDGAQRQRQVKRHPHDVAREDNGDGKRDLNTEQVYLGARPKSS